MAENSSIEWTDHTFNSWIGCTKVHAGCANCYAEADFDKRRGKAKWGPNGTRVATSPANWAKPLKWNRDAACHESFDCNAGDHSDACPQNVRPRVFCASLADVFEDWREFLLDHHGDVDGRDMDDLRRELFGLIDQTPNLDWLLLTKRPENIMRMLYGGRRENIWLLTSVSDQATADAMIPALFEARDYSPVLGLSCEPLLGPIDLTPYLGRGGIDWVIAGGESGPNARPSSPVWYRHLCDQCEGAGVPFFFKQWGEWGSILGHDLDDWTRRTDATLGAITPAGKFIPKGRALMGDGDIMARFGKKLAGRLLDGVEHNGIPSVESGASA